MESLKLYGKSDLRFEEAEKPIIRKANEVIVEVKAVGICGSDLSRYKKLGPYIPGMIWGHEFSGIISEIGEDVKEVKVGDRVATCPALVCEDLEVEECYYCKKSEYARCLNLTVVGAKHPGGFAEYVALPEKNVLKLPDSVDFESAAMIEPSAVVAHGLFKSNAKAGDDLVVVGCGNIGLLTIKWAQVMGFDKIIALDINDAALKSAKETGATHTINTLKVDPLEELAKITNHLGAQCVVESAGSPITSAQVFAYAKKGGDVIFMGIPYADVNIERFYFEQIVRKELNVIGSWNAISAPFPGDEWSATIKALSSGKIEFKSMISHRLSLSDGPSIFEEITNNRNKNFGKVMFYPNV
ncbi:galactitol-1-phosphate 5-dehydrogenase [Vagococcus fluvialis]|uniref:Galactitol-1-phosphate 5-dehydrogenase n=1 Tax=Vagococcus fluvialis TaxID=2738 RepID=A0A7X6D7R9_9ENTE|nr:galactitol-1-phosphate 5-dehydrogenase [Vagococcus fluvialis]NKC67395.1 galactitol-1-phosphate 5-dehydrogenase [Vagococcus fluvialis]